MWGTGDVSNQAGGYFNSSEASPSFQDKKPARRSQNIFPVTIEQIVTSPEDGLKIGETEVNMATICGLVLSVEITSTKITYRILDDTGVIIANLWLDNGVPEEPKTSLVVENTYCKVFGSVRNQLGAKTIMIFKILPVTDLRELTLHLLEVVHSNTMALTTPQADPGMGMQNRSNQLPNSMMADQSLKSSGGLNIKQQMVYDVVKNCVAEMGISRKEIFGALKGRITDREIDEILAFMCGEGHIYTTLDEDHFQNTD